MLFKIFALDYFHIFDTYCYMQWEIEITLYYIVYMFISVSLAKYRMAHHVRMAPATQAGIQTPGRWRAPLPSLNMKHIKVCGSHRIRGICASFFVLKLITIWHAGKDCITGQIVKGRKITLL